MIVTLIQNVAPTRQGLPMPVELSRYGTVPHWSVNDGTVPVGGRFRQE
jgi:hypothetical protein